MVTDIVFIYLFHRKMLLVDFGVEIPRKSFFHEVRRWFERDMTAIRIKIGGIAIGLGIDRILAGTACTYPDTYRPVAERTRYQ